MESQPAREQRRSPRIRHDLVVDLHHKRGTRRLHAVDVARHGLFIATADPPPERHLVQLTVHLPAGPIRCAASVTRTLRHEGHIDGVGVQFFALSDDAKGRWDDFIFALQRTSSGPHPVAPSTPSLPGGKTTPPREAASATFLVKLKSVERLREFGESQIAAGGTMLFTPVLRAPGEIVTLTIVHPKSDEEFRLPGTVVQAYGDRPKRLEIHFLGVTPALLKEFASYVETGHPPIVQREAPQLPPQAPVAPPAREVDLDLDVDIWGEDSLDDPDDDQWRAPGDVGLPETLIPRPAFPPPVHTEKNDLRPISHETKVLVDAGLRPSTVLVRCEREGNGCTDEPYAIDLGPCRGILGLVSDHVAFLSHKTGRVVTAARLVSAQERKARSEKFAKDGGRLDDAVDIATMLSAAALSDDPKDPETGALLKQTRAVEKLADIVKSQKPGDPAAKTRIPCVACKTGRLVVEKLN